MTRKPAPQSKLSRKVGVRTVSKRELFYRVVLQLIGGDVITTTSEQSRSNPWDTEHLGLNLERERVVRVLESVIEKSITTRVENSTVRKNPPLDTCSSRNRNHSRHSRNPAHSRNRRHSQSKFRDAISCNDLLRERDRSLRRPSL